MMSGRLAGQKPQRGDLFIAARPPWDYPNPSGVACGDSTFLARNGQMQVTALGFVGGTELRGAYPLC